MKKYSILSRLLSALLVLVMVLSVVPSNVLAAYYYEVSIGDIAEKYIDDEGNVIDHTGDPGLGAGTDSEGNAIDNAINNADVISWPIRIYDYLNDGMLFEYANTNATGDISDMRGGAYGGGTPAPHFDGAKAILGTDYTVDWGYAENAYTYWFRQVSPFDSSKSLVEAVNFKSPSHLHIVPDQNYNSDMRPMVLSDFYNDNTTSGYSKDRVRYAVIVYRTEGLTSSTAKVNLGWSTNLTSGTAYQDGNGNSLGVYYDYRGSVSLEVNDDEWNYAVIDMNAGTLKSKWSSINTVYRVFADFSMTNTSESVDISHIAYFASEFEAHEFGKDCVAFDNDPGEFLDAHTEYTEGQEVAVAKPTTNANGMDFSVADNSTGGYAVDTYEGWTATPTYYNYLRYTVGGVKITEVDNGERSYVSVSNSENTSDRSLFLWEWQNGGDLRYVTIVYKTTGFTADQKIGFYTRESGGGGSNMATSLSGASKSATLKRSEGTWTYATYAFSDFNDGDYVAGRLYTQYGMYLPSCLTGSANANKSLDIAFVQLLNDRTAANTYGQQGADYMNGKTTTVSGSYTTAQKSWNQGNNVAFSLLYANQGGGWGSVAGGTSTLENGYFNYQIGKTPWTGTSATETNNDRTTAKNNGYTVADDIFLLNSWQMVEGDIGFYDMSVLDLSYTLYNKLYSGVMTAGLLESQLTTVALNGKPYRVPDYKEETIEYIAYLLKSALSVGQRDSSGNYNYNFVRGTANAEQFGYTSDGKPMDLASALRKQLGIVLPANGNCTSGHKPVGDYAALTAAQKAELIGPFADCVGKIDSFVEAAYYLLMNLYVDNSYNQAQDEYNYLVLSSATVDGKPAFVFDGGFTTGLVSETANTEAYRNSSESAIKYNSQSGFISISNNPTNNPGKETLTQFAVSKDKVYFGTTTTTTRFPFLPVTHAEGVYAGETKSPYFLDDGYGVMGITEEGGTFVNRNFNYAIASNGEFIYYEEDDLFFDFEGDDDVYLFINGELVVDVGAAHSITTVKMRVADYVAWAKNVLSGLSGYEAHMSDRQLETLIANKSEEQKAEYRRAHRLNLEDGEICSFDFYYMERHGWGANCRIVSNIRVTDPAMRVDKTAHQNGEEIAMSDVIVASDPVEYNFTMVNHGSSKLFNLTFDDSTVGVSLDYTKGLEVAAGYNGVYVFDSHGGTLEASDLMATVTGYMPVAEGSGTHYHEGNGVYTPGTHVKKPNGTYSPQENGTYLQVPTSGGGYEYLACTHQYVSVDVTFKDNAALINFLQILDADGLDHDELGTDYLQKGYGLWVDADVTIKGIYYRLSVQQVAAGVLDNIVYATATSQPEPSSSGSKLLYSHDNHRIYVAGPPEYYQWAGHNVYLPIIDVVADAKEAAANSGNQANEYKDFLQNLGDTYNYRLCDKFGRVIAEQDETANVYKYDDGYIIKYPNAGTYTFYILVTSNKLTDSSNAADFEEKTYAIVRVTMHVTDTESSYYVLDYGLSTEDLGTNGELFKNDELLGSSSINMAKMMGITLTKPEYLDYTKNKANYNRIDFKPLESTSNIQVGGGSYSLNVSSGKEITYNAYTGQYSLNQVGTSQLNVYTPAAWSTAFVYFWYDGGSNNGWPGTEMNKVTAGQFRLDIPADVVHIIISNGEKQTNDLLINAGMENTVTVTDTGEERLDANVSNFVPVTVNATVPAGWGPAYLYCWHSETNKNNGEWPGTAMELVDGKYTLNVPGSFDRMIVNNNNGLQTVDLTVPSGANLNIDLTKQNAKTVTADVSAVPGWGDVYLYCWNANGNNGNFPGTKMAEKNGLHFLDVEAGYTSMIVNNNNGMQTLDLVGILGNANPAIRLTGEMDNGKYKAEVKYNATVSPYSTVTDTCTIYVKADWPDAYLYYWNNNGVVPHAWPGAHMTKVENGLFALDIPVDSSYVIFNSGYDVKVVDGVVMQGHQTGDLSIKKGVDAVITMAGTDANGYSLASIDYNDDFTFTPGKFMDEAYSIWMAITVHSTDNSTLPTALGNAIDVSEEVQMYKKITVVPASVVYYEDDFPAITYSGSQTTANTFTPIGTSSDLSQSVDQEQEYGQDDAYKNNTDLSGNSLRVITINDANVTASFEFKGTGFELLSRTQAKEYGTIQVTVTEKDTNTVVQKIPVIAEFDNDDNGGADEIYQVPLIRVDGLEYGTYVVSINGAPARDYSAEKVNGQYPIITSYFYIDGLRIFEPMGNTDPKDNDTNESYYDEDERNVTFDELRELIVDGKVAAAAFNGETMTVSTGNLSWTENLNGMQHGFREEIEYEGNQVNTVDEYLTMGPNNEVYFNGDVKNEALVFYVEKDSSGNSNLQIAVHAVDAGLFVGSASTGMNAVVEYGTQKTDGTFVWKPLVTVTSGTEQYYTIDLTDCAVDTSNRIQVAVRVTSGMASFTSLKYNGLEIVTINGEAATMKYKNGMLTAVSANDSGEAVSTAVEERSYPAFATLSLLMRAPSTSFVPVEPETGVKERFDIAYASMTAGNSLAINFAFAQNNMEDWNGAYAEIVKAYADGRGDAVQTIAFEDWNTTTINSDAHFYVTFNGIAAKEMTDDVHVTIYNADGEAISNTWTDSVRSQAMRNLAKDTISDAEKTMVVDMLNYGAAAQEFFGYHTDDLANAMLTDDQKAIATSDTTYTDTHTGSENYFASNLLLESNIKLMFAFRNVDESMKAVITFTNHYGKEKELVVNGSEFQKNGSFYVVTVQELVVSDCRQDVTCRIYDGDEVVAEVTDSVASYAARKGMDSVLFEMLMKFSDSAYAYFHQ